MGPLLALGLVAAVGTRTAIALSVMIPGVAAAGAIIYAISHTTAPAQRDKVKLRFHVRPVLQGRLGQVLAATALFEAGNAAATLFILRASSQLSPGHGTNHATQTALGLYVAYNAAATVASIPAGCLSDRLGSGGPVQVLLAGVILFAIAYATLAVGTTSIVLLAVPFIAAGIAIGCVETAEHSAVAGLAPAKAKGLSVRDARHHSGDRKLCRQRRRWAHLEPCFPDRCVLVPDSLDGARFDCFGFYGCKGTRIRSCRLIVTACRHAVTQQTARPERPSATLPTGYRAAGCTTDQPR